MADRSSLARLLRSAQYEVIPLDGVEDAVAEHVPTDLTVTVTASPTRGLEPTLELAERLTARGFRVVPHLSARLVAGEAQLREIVERLGAIGVRGVLVVAGDVEEPTGPYGDAASLLVALDRLGHGLDEIGITGYPESHPFISDEATIASMYDKEPYATHIVSQVCFDAQTIGTWIERVRKRGVHLPIYVGLPGPVDRLRLLRISSRIGVGESMRFLRHGGRWAARLFVPGAYRPERLLRDLAPYVADPAMAVPGLHVYTFNEVARTESWRQELLGRLDA